jgi:predicted acylesterase/phospholipase RssA
VGSCSAKNAPRGFAHLGVMRALEEAGVPIDVVGGTSIGAIMAGVFAIGMDDAERVKALTDNVGRLITLTLPIVAVSSGRRVDRLLAERLGSVAIEDLPRRFFCVSASLNRAEEVVHERGPLGPGAALNNVPADLMRDRVGSGSVIAVSVSPEVEPLVTAPFGPGLSGWRVFGRRLNPFASPQPVCRVARQPSHESSPPGRRRPSLDRPQDGRPARPRGLEGRIVKSR